jgi:hypothetical protein
MELKKEGKKVFILYPHAVIKDELLDYLIMTGFETYVINDHERALRLLAIFPDSIMFINIDQGQSVEEWEKYIKGITASSHTKWCRLGILSYNPDQSLMKRCLSSLTLLCGYIYLQVGFKEFTRTMLATLEANMARGRRKYIRAAAGDDPTATVNVKGAHGFYNGRILDISAVGIAARFEQFDILPANTKIKEMQLKIRGARILTDAVFMGKRSSDVYIILFDLPRMDPDHKILINRFIKTTLQKYLDNLQI